MIDPATLTALVSSTVALLSPLFAKAIDKGVEEIGKSAAGALLTKLKERLGGTPAQKPLEDLAALPEDPDNQADLRKQLKAAVQADPALVAFLQQWLEQGQQQAPTLGITQTANVTGNNNKTVQIAGSGNSVS
ncbi:MAG: hypothetical protein ABIP34_07605 [Rhodoferax sp.]|uniref:hypothetical protein n=1 Tax=Rhodoferax sp. TaxID=50421 RepID=UPI003263375A